MFTQFFNEWDEALKNERIISTKHNLGGQVTWQSGVIKFRGTEIQTNRKADGRGGYQVELFVPKTNKFISNSRFPTKAKCAEAILLSLIPGMELEDRRAARAERRAVAIRKEIFKSRVEKLRKITLSKEDFAWFSDLLNRNLQANNAFYDDKFLDVLAKFHSRLLCEEEYLLTVPENNRSWHMARLYELVILIRRRAMHAKGGYALKMRDAAVLFRSQPNPEIHLPQGILMTKDLFRDIDAFLHQDISCLVHLCDNMISYYGYRMETTPEQIMAAMEERRQRAKERKLRRLDGTMEQPRGPYTVFGDATPSSKPEEPQQQPYRSRQFNRGPRQNNGYRKPSMSRPGMVSLTDVFGDQLSNFKFASETPDVTVSTDTPQGN